MNDDERVELAKIVTSFEDFVRQYAKDEERKRQEKIDDKEHTQRWRNGFKEDLRALDKKIDDTKKEINDQIKPVVRDHQIVVGTGKWLGKLGGSGGIIGGLLWLWNHFREKVN